MRVPINASERRGRVAGIKQSDLYPYYGATGQVGYIDGYLFSGEHVLIGEDGAPFLDPLKSTAYIATGEFWVNNHAHILTSPISNKYLCHFLNQIDYSEHVTGTTRLKLNQAALRKIPLSVAPENEQHRIVAKIEELFSELDNGIESLKTAREQLKVYRQAVLKHAFEGKLTAEWREHNKGRLETADQLLARIKTEREACHQQRLTDWKTAVKAWEADGKEGKRPTKPSAFKQPTEITSAETKILPKIPDCWRYVRLSEVAQIGSGMSVSASRKVNDPIEVAYLRVANVQRGFLDLSQIKYMSIEKQQLDGLQLKKWDVFFNEGGDRDKLGRGWVWESEITPCITQNHVFRASPYITSEITSKIISYWGNTFGQGYFEKTGKQTTNLASINKKVLSDFPIPLLSPEEEAEIYKRVDLVMSALNVQEDEISIALKQSEALRQSILKKAFSGQLVAQDPNDEPAAVLLERIKADKAAQAATRKKAGKAKPRRKKGIITMENLISVLEEQSGWISATEAFGKCGVSDGAETEAVEKLYEQLRDYIGSKQINVERRGDEDWLILNREEVA